MKLIFHGHGEKYAVEQSLLAFFPGERPVYEAASAGENAAEISLSCGRVWATAATSLTYGGASARAVARVKLADAPDEYERERLRQRAIKLSFFKAGRALTGETPAWGALTGIRPGKVAARLLDEGNSERQVDRILRDTYFVSARRRRLCLESARAGRTAQRALRPEELSLYVGIPFCPTRCAYCSFVSHSVEKSFHLVEPYLAALHREIDSAAAMVRELGLRVRSFYMGGGTPTTLSAPQLEALLTHLARAFSFAPGMESTVEAGRPDTITPEKLTALRRCGVNRVSVNPQTMSDPVLAAIGRRHTASDIRRAMEQVRGAGFDHINMDLIAGLPEDTPQGFCRSLDECLTLGADNITVHTLSLKKGSRILLEGNAIPSPQAVGEMLAYAETALRAHSFAPYYLYRQKYMSGSFENVGWCISGGECLYNIYIMEELHTILSLGAGGSTKMVEPGCGRIERVFNLKYPQEYIDRPEKIQTNQLAFRRFYDEVKKI